MSGGNIIYYPIRNATGGGTVTSVSLTGDGVLFQATPGTPVTTAGTLTPVLNLQTNNTVLAGPISGASATPSFRFLVPADIPNISAASITSGILALAQGGNAFLHLGDLIYGGVAAAPTILAGNITATKKFLTQTGTGGLSAAPGWNIIVAGDIPNLPASIITSGQLPVIYGGTGTATPGLVAGANITITGTWPDQTIAASGGSGSVTSVGLSTNSSFLTVASSPITTSGTITLNLTTGLTANQVLATPDSVTGVVGLRLLVANDIPGLPATIITTGILPLARGGNTFTLLGDMIYGGTSALPTVLSGNTSATKMILSQTGNGTISAAPVWAVLVAGDIPSLSTAILTSGLLPVARGGTGTASPGLVAGTNISISGSWPNQTVTATGGGGAVTSVDMSTDGSWMTVGGNPITTSGTITLNRTSGLTGNEVLATPDGTTGKVGLRALVAGDIPSLPASIITSGVLALANGGNTFALLGDIIYGGVSAVPTVLSGNTTITKKYLSQTGNGTISAAPAWAQIAAADLSNGVTGTGAVVLAGTPTFTGHPVTPTVTITGATPTVSAGQLGLGTTNGVGNGSFVVLTAPAFGTGAGPATPNVIVGWVKLNLAGTDIWVPYAV